MTTFAFEYEKTELDCGLHNYEQVFHSFSLCHYYYNYIQIISLHVVSKWVNPFIFNLGWIRIFLYWSWLCRRRNCIKIFHNRSGQPIQKVPLLHCKYSWLLWVILIFTLKDINIILLTISCYSVYYFAILFRPVIKDQTLRQRSWLP